MGQRGVCGLPFGRNQRRDARVSQLRREAKEKAKALRKQLAVFDKLTDGVWERERDVEGERAQRAASKEFVIRPGANRARCEADAQTAGGQAALAGARRTGRKRKLSGDDLRRLQAILLAGARGQGHETDWWPLRRLLSTRIMGAALSFGAPPARGPSLAASR